MPSSIPVTSEPSTEIQPTEPSITTTSDPSSVSSTAYIELQTTSSSAAKPPITVTGLSSVSSTTAAASISSTAVNPSSTVPTPSQTLDKLSFIVGIVAAFVISFIIIGVTLLIRSRGLLTCGGKKHRSQRYDPDDIQLDRYLNQRNGSIDADRKKSGKSARRAETPTKNNGSQIQDAWTEAIKEADEDPYAISGDPDIIQTYVTLSAEPAQPMYAQVDKKKKRDKNKLPKLAPECTLNDTDFGNFDRQLELDSFDEEAESPYYELNDDDLMEIAKQTDNRDSSFRKPESGLSNEAFDSKYGPPDDDLLSNGNRVVIENDLYVTSGRLNGRNYNTYTGNLTDGSDVV
ncbi:uncharacterized protein LOC141902010 isoform X2 [Tubulanus polymorphus]|uniref:uncharacterized protein LOC141902010 isoform X2 n=1 Tax=Tubulanus polymorphus TaxID=672921 RepID=UPI003DA646FF